MAGCDGRMKSREYYTVENKKSSEGFCNFNRWMCKVYI